MWFAGSVVNDPVFAVLVSHILSLAVTGIQYNIFHLGRNALRMASESA